MRLDLRRGQVAQLVEQGIENPRVGSSILSLATSFRKAYPCKTGCKPFYFVAFKRLYRRWNGDFCPSQTWSDRCTII